MWGSEISRVFLERCYVALGVAVCRAPVVVVFGGERCSIYGIP